jgi:4-amino-4-deoxy-L-arabinose transferase-like glycosyltransferase
VAVAPKYLYYFDSVNFALAIDEFNPAKHQPQPPGYPLFVGLLRLLHLVLPRAEHVLIAAGILVAAAAAMLLWRLTKEMYGDCAALLALAGFLLTPPCWLGGVTNQVRLSLALYSAGVAWVAWRTLSSPSRKMWMYLLFAALGFGAGFRPDFGVQLAPLILWVWWRCGRSIPTLAISSIVALVSTVPWMAPTVMAVGGVAEWFRLMDTYAQEQFRGSSAAWGAPVQAAWKMALQALAWNGLTAIAWIWAVPFVWRSSALTETRTKFLAVWGLPILCFSAFVHIGDPDQALGSIPAVCATGGAILNALLHKFGRERQMLPLAAAVMSVNALLFFFPKGRLARASSYSAVASIDRATQSVFNAIHMVKRGESAAILEHGAVVTWRHLSYYFNEDAVMNLPENPAENSWVLRNRQIVSTMQPADKLPGLRRVILLAPKQDTEAMRAAGWREHDHLFYRDVAPGTVIAIGPYLLTQP